MSYSMSGFGGRAASPKLQKCKRCDLNFLKELDNCTHCSELNDHELLIFKAQYQQARKENAKLGKYLFFGALLIGGLLLLSFL